MLEEFGPLVAKFDMWPRPHSCLNVATSKGYSLWNINSLASRFNNTAKAVLNNLMTGDKKQSKTLFLAIFDPRSSIVKSVFDCRQSGVLFIVCYCSHCVCGVCAGSLFWCLIRDIVLVYMGGSGGGGKGSGPSPLKNHKNIGFHSMVRIP